MPTEFAFRVSTYMSLALACACLGYAEWELLPEVTGFMAVVLALLAVSFRYEGRIELSLARANVLGLGIAVVGVGWLAKKWTSVPTGVMANLTWPTNILPYAGPLLMVLIPAKLFRPKHVGDWWAMQGVGLAAVGLAAALADDAAFVVLLAAYLVFAVLSLTLFYYRRSGGYVAPIPTGGRPATPPAVVYAQSNAASTRPPPYQFAVGRTLRWIGYALALAAPLFLLTPRTGAPSWGLASQRIAVAYAPEQTLDLNRTGDLATNREVAFEVTAADADGNPKDDLDANALWRGRGYRSYDGGRWTQGGQGGVGRPFTTDSVDSKKGSAADAWRRSGRVPFTLEFVSKAPTPTTVLLSPAEWVPGAASPVTTVGGEVSWVVFTDASLNPNGSPGRQPYRQVAVPPVEPEWGLGTPFAANTANPQVWASILTSLTRVTSARIRGLADRRLREWIAAGKLPPNALAEAAPGQARVAPEHFRAVAVAFRDWLAASGEYTYSAKLRREDKSLDPIEDFLLNVKAGHCEWFAAAHALLVRAVGIPCQFVLGFRGCEPLGNGKYQILQEHAHAWVEVLVPAATGGSRWRWLSLDPTSGGEVASAEPLGWWGSAKQTGVDFIADYILGYSPDKQRKAIADAKSFAGDNWLYLVPGVAVVVAWRTRRRWWPRHDGPPAAPHPMTAAGGPKWFAAYLAANSRLGLMPTAGQTPKEFAELVAVALRSSPAGAAVAEVPTYITSKFYRVRYGGVTLTEAEDAEVATAVTRFAAAVQDLSVLTAHGAPQP